jgi:hypothetical protein
MHHSLMNSRCILSWVIKVILKLCLPMAFQVAKPTSTSVFFNFVMLLKWQSSISIFSQIWKYSKYKSRNFNHLFIFKAIVEKIDDF